MRIATLLARLVFAVPFLLLSTAVLAQEPGKLVLVHYMPWYQSKPISGHWGWHWTMNKFNPEHLQVNGLREIATHDPPLFGPYDSGDEHALECQVQLMKLAGIDGVVIDWYGTSDFRDYAVVHLNTQKLIRQLKRAKLKYAICYEDQSVKHMVEGNALPKSKDLIEGEQALKWLLDNCFNDEAYVRLDGRPALLIFGPQYFSRVQLQTLNSLLPTRARIFGLPHLAEGAGLDGAFGWPPVSGGRKIAVTEWLEYLNRLNANSDSISVVFPGFHDIYKEAQVRDSYGSIDDRDGQTFSESLSLALKGKSPIVQIATWNDYGEGTNIEPSVEKGFLYLEKLQRQLSANNGHTFDDLRLPVKLYELRKSHAQQPAQISVLNRASDYLFAGECKQARTVLEALK